MAALKERANAAFKRGHYEEALDLYRDAISLACADTQMAQNSFAVSFVAVCHSNSAECLLQMGQWRAAVESSESALQLLPLSLERCEAGSRIVRQRRSAPSWGFAALLTHCPSFSCPACLTGTHACRASTAEVIIHPLRTSPAAW